MYQRHRKNSGISVELLAPAKNCLPAPLPYRTMGTPRGKQLMAGKILWSPPVRQLTHKWKRTVGEELP